MSGGGSYPAGAAVAPPEGVWTVFLRRICRNKTAIIGLIIFVFICLACLFAPLLTKYNYAAIDPQNRLAVPSLEHLLGTDNLGRDVFTRLLYGGRVTLRIALVSTVLAAAFGSIIGLMAGYFGGVIDFIISPVLDILASVPLIILALLSEAVLGWGSGNFMYAMAIAAVPQFARLVRASVMDEMGREYIEASRALGVSHLKIITRRIFHNIAPPLIIRFTSGVAEALLTCTIMGYLSIGINPPTPEWGAIVYYAKQFIRSTPRLIIIPCVLITVSVISLCLFGDGLRDALDPRDGDAKVKRTRAKRKSGKDDTRSVEPDSHNGGGEAETLLEVSGLDVSFITPRGELRAVNSISYSVRRGEIMGLVGESGSGKSVEAYSIMGLLASTARVNAGSALFEGRDVLAYTQKELKAFRGSEISMIFQNPMSYLDPVFTIGRQMTETIRAHDKTVTRRQARARSVEMLRAVSIRDPEQVMRQYPFELSGGMCQRVLISMALLCEPKLLIADEPTTALDVTIQAQIVGLLKRIQRERGMAMIYITHNFGIVAELCDRISVMCGGYILEQGTTDDIFYRTAHPYTQALLKTMPRMDLTEQEPLVPIEGTPVEQTTLPEGCVFHPRCPSCMDVCRQSVPPVTALQPGHSASCWLLSAEHSREGVSSDG